MPDIESLANINQYIIAKVGAGRYKVAQLLGTMFTIALAAYQNDLTRIKRAYV
jgi:aspartate/glutamate racemase